MNSFSIMPYEHQSILDSYQQWLVSDLYQNYYFDNLNDPNFLQKLSILQAEGIRHDIGVHAAVTHGSIQEASSQVGRKIQSAASLITSSLDDGFTMMNTRMLEVNGNLRSIDKGIGTVNQTLQQGNQILSNIDGGIAQMNRGVNAVASGVAQMNRGINAVASGVNRLDSHVVAGFNQLDRHILAGFTALSSNISQAASVVQYQLQQSEIVLRQILDELRIPESQRERRYHIEEGMKYFNKGMQSGDCLYFEDALDEFSTAISIERKDFFSWYYTGMIYLYSKDRINTEKALSAFDRYIHYADALPQRHHLFDEAIMMKAECKYLMQDVDAAYHLVERLVPSSTKAALRAMKYLSASTDSNKQKQAVEILKGLMQQNPYIVMQILEDYDLLSNTFITDYLSKFKIEVSKEINQLISKLDKDMESLKKYSLSCYRDVFDELNSLKARAKSIASNMGVVDALMLREKLLLMLEKTSDTINKLAEQERERVKQERLAKERAEQKRIAEERLAYLKAHGLVDLGLPSGTLWKDKNEEGDFYTYKQALDKFGDRLPAKNQLEELRDKCRWKWTISGYKVTGPSGQSIFLPAAGERDCKGNVHYVGSNGRYWSSTPSGSEEAWYLSFYSVVGMYSRNRCYGHSVRLVQD